jgi:cyclopropane fatty-acyl-phospholipid synthase-like methyltransferase
MGLYQNVERVLADLRASGVADTDRLSVDQLTRFDQYHYEGTDAVDDAIAVLRATQDARILDVGSGLGGPARYIADRSGVAVTALELQQDLHETALALTNRCGLNHVVSHVCGDMLLDPLAADSHSGIVSMLCFLHIADRGALFASCTRTLRPNGVMFIDDYYARQPLDKHERAALRDKIYCPYLPSLERYKEDLQDAGFSEVAVEDKTADWTAFVTDRLARFRGGRADLERRYSTDTVEALDDFYTTVAGLFTGGNLGGVRLVARLDNGD